MTYVVITEGGLMYGPFANVIAAAKWGDENLSAQNGWTITKLIGPAAVTG